MHQQRPLRSVASCSGHLEIVRALIRGGADPNAAQCGATALHRAAFAGHLEICKELLDAGSDVSARDISFRDCRTALHKASSQNHSELCRLLVEAGAKSVGDREGKHPFELSTDPVLQAWLREVPLGEHLEPPSELPPLDEHALALCNGEYNPPSWEPVTTTMEESNLVERREHAKRVVERAIEAGSVGLVCPICGEGAVAVVKQPCCGAMVCRSCSQQVRRGAKVCVCRN
jgi:hypothetical protein